MSPSAVSFDADSRSLSAAGITLERIEPLLDGRQIDCSAPEISTSGDGWTLAWSFGPATDPARPRSVLVLRITRLLPERGLLLDVALESADPDVRLQSIGLRIGKTDGVLRYLRNGYTSWDGSYFVEPDKARGDTDSGSAALTGYAMTALMGNTGQSCVLGFLRHDRFQSRLRFAFAQGPLSIDVETLTDGVSHGGRIQAEPLVLLAGTAVEETLRRWARLVCNASPLPPRIRENRITGWCSWYSLYNSISEAVLLEHLRAATRFRDTYHLPFEVFQIDDGFTPEMGDWLEVKPQFQRGMAPLLQDIAAAGFVPGLWIAPFMVGNRSQLYAAHPDWVVTDRATGLPLVPMKFYGEFRWHKRSEEYYILDITVPAAEAYIRNVFRVWTREWGCRYFKTDFMYFGSEYGPDQARWHEPGLSRMEVWMRMARLIREEIGDSLWLGCGGPIWAPIGLMDAVRTGRDIGVSWRGHHSAESLLRDQTSRNFANGIFWQADPDCILLRSRFHELTDTEVHSLALFAALTGGLLMTSDQLDEVCAERRQLFAQLAGDGRVRTCSFPQLGQGDPVLVQQVLQSDGSVLINMFNTGDTAADRVVPGDAARAMRVSLAAHEARLLTFRP
ncbi:MAG: alpha-galactosidase [Gammaproteobacteria bacterium]|nr:alpha-galactosidase [Gammaproteobacteria bacterium]